MILVKTPLRLSFFGGGSDLAAYYTKRPGFCLSTTIDQYMYISICKTSIPGIKVMYSEIEMADKVDDIKHDRVRETLKLFDINSNLEIGSFAEIPTKGTGLGSSSTFTVGLINGLSALNRTPISRYDLARTASTIEIDYCKQPIGMQDQFAAAYGGFNSFTFNEDRVDVSPVSVPKIITNNLNDQLLLFYTGIKRNTADILTEQESNTNTNKDTLDSLSTMIDIGKEALNSLYKGRVDDFGAMLGESWNYKKTLSSSISNPLIDEWYEKALSSGALGGKIAGAGGGGFLLLYVPYDKQTKVIEAMNACGLTLFNFRFSENGSEIVYNN